MATDPTQPTDRSRYCGSPLCTGDDNCPEVDMCVCGASCASHGFGDGHSPVSAHYYYLKDTETNA